jgi:putative Ca2+/H+ antiporter (TMEM165/GDT1 family)
VIGAQGSFSAVLLLAFWAVFIAELVGDKSIYALTSLGLRFRWPMVLAAYIAASAIKMLAAVILGSAVMGFQSRWTYWISAVAFFVSAVLIWVDEPAKLAHNQNPQPGWSKGLVICFSAFLFAEWGDPGQIAAAALVLRSHVIAATWVGGTLALVAKGVAALVLGVQIRNRLPATALRVLSSLSCCVLGILTMGQGIS